MIRASFSFWRSGIASWPTLAATITAVTALINGRVPGRPGQGAGSAKAVRVDRDTRRKRAQLRLRRNGAGGRTDRVYRQVGMPLRSASGWVAEGLGPCPGYLLSMTMKVFAIS